MGRWRCEWVIRWRVVMRVGRVLEEVDEWVGCLVWDSGFCSMIRSWVT